MIYFSVNHTILFNVYSSLIFVKTSLLKWVAIHQTLKKSLKAEEKRNIVEGHLQAVPQIVEVTAIKNREENQDHGREISSFVHIHMKKGKYIISVLKL